MTTTLQQRALTISALPPATAPEGFPMHMVAAGDTLFLATADGRDAAVLLEALDPQTIEALRDRIDTLLRRGNAMLAEMAAREAVAAS